MGAGGQPLERRLRSARGRHPLAARRPWTRSGEILRPYPGAVETGADPGDLSTRIAAGGPRFGRGNASQAFRRGRRTARQRRPLPPGRNVPVPSRRASPGKGGRTGRGTPPPRRRTPPAHEDDPARGGRVHGGHLGVEPGAAQLRHRHVREDRVEALTPGDPGHRILGGRLQNDVPPLQHPQQAAADQRLVVSRMVIARNSSLHQESPCHLPVAVPRARSTEGLPLRPLGVSEVMCKLTCVGGMRCS
jgi:hypothetical protein